MADGKLVFPIRFDLDSAVKNASGDIDKVLRRMETMIQHRPLKVQMDLVSNNADIGRMLLRAQNMLPKQGSIASLRKEMSALVAEWEKLSEAERTATDSSGNFTGRAGEIVRRYAELTSVARTHAQSLSEIQRAADKAVAAEEKKMAVQQKAVAKSQQMVAMLKAEETSLTAVGAKLKFYQDIANRHDFGSSQFKYATEQINRLGAQYQRLQDIMNKNTGNGGKDVVGAERMKATLRGAENSIESVKAKLKVLDQILSKTPQDSFGFRRAIEEASRLRGVLDSMQARNQKSFAGLDEATLSAQISKLTQLREQIRSVDAQLHELQQARANNGGKWAGPMDEQLANNLIKQRMEYTKQLNEMSKTGADLQKAREKEINAIIAKRQAQQDKHRKSIEDAVAARKKEKAILTADMSIISNIEAKLRLMQGKLTNTSMKSGEFEKIAKEVERLTKKLDEARRKMAELTGHSTPGTSRQVANVRKVTDEYSKQLTYVDRLIRRMMVYGSIGMIGSFLQQVREVTAQFELQRVSLGAILQDQNKANQLFSEIKSFALKSPVSILDLTKYTKQLAAYKIGYDELFETTKKLTDVSVGLGVSMDRVVLAYGQVRATGHLRASEIRQFTEMGVPIVEELAAKLSKMNGEMVTAAQVMDMVSKRAISFDMVKDVFDDMTSAGGIFYNMQEKQGNTLFGLWAKLGDAASVMYDEIGRTESVNSGMKELIQTLTDLMRNWQDVGKTVVIAGAAFLGMRAHAKLAAVSANEVGMKTAMYRMELQRLQTQYALATGQSKAMIAAQMGLVNVQKMAATATTALGGALKKVKAALVSTGWGALAVGLGIVIEKLFFATSAADSLNESLGKIMDDSVVEQGKSVRDFERLASVATDVKKGYKERKEALDELQRTYKDILPAEALELEYLAKLRGNYDSLTNSIRTYVAEQQKRKAVDEITSTYGAEKRKYESKLTDFFRSEGWSEGEIAKFWEEFYRIAADKSKTLEQVVYEAAKKGGHEGFETAQKLLNNQGFLRDLNVAAAEETGWSINGVDYIDLLREAVIKENLALEQNEERTKAAATAQSEFAAAYAAAAERIKDMPLTKSNGARVERESYLGGQMVANEEVKAIFNILKAGFKDAGLVWEEGFGEFINKVNASKPELISSLDFSVITDSLAEQLNDPKLDDAQREVITKLITTAREAQQKYREIVPSDPVVQVWRQRFRIIANSVAEFRSKYNQYLMMAGEDLEAYNKRLKDSLEDLRSKVKGLLATQALVAKAGILARLLYGTTADEIQERIDEANEEIKIIEKVLSEQPSFEKNKKKGGSKGGKQDPRLQNLKEEISLVQKLFKEYQELEKQEGGRKAEADMNRLAGATIKMLSNKHGIGLPKTAKDVTSALEILYKKMSQLPRKVFPTLDKDLKELRWTIEKVDIDESQKQIERQLKEIAERISRTKTAKEFYEKILGQTGDVDLALGVSLHLYGSQGKELNKQMREQIEMLIGSASAPLDKFIFRADDTFDAKELREYAEVFRDELGGIESKAYKELIKICEDADKDFVKTLEGWMKATEKAKTYSEKLLDLRRRTQTEMDEISRLSGYAQQELAGLLEIEDPTDSQRERIESLRSLLTLYFDLIEGYTRKENEEVANLQYEAFKDSPMYVQMFDNLDNASGTMLRNMKKRMEELKEQWKNLSPVQLKEMQSRLREIDEQLARRNPFSSLASAIKKYRDYMKNGEPDGGTKSEAEAEKRLDDAAKARLEAEKEYLEILHKQGATKEDIEKAQSKFNRAQSDEDTAAKALENWKKVKDVIGISANEMMQMFNWAGDIAKGIADISEAMGADAEDVQYWNDIADALGQISGGIQDIVGAALDGNVIGAISSTLTAVPKMFAGFANLFSAGKIKRANKEIKRQQEIIDGLEYSYSRLEKTMESVFGADYIDDFNAKQRVLQAKATAIQAQLAAERSKGKKADKDKIKDYENAYRDTMDEIADMESELTDKFLGSDRAGAAREFAEAWLDAKATFESTADAMESKYKEMIRSMIVEGAAARIIDNILSPMWEQMDAMLGENDITGAIDYLVNGMDRFITDADNGMNVLWKALEARGYDMRAMLGDADTSLSGISRDIASASEESINGLAAGINTQNFYISQQLAEVRAIRMMMESGSGPAASGGRVDVTALQSEALGQLQSIDRHTAEMVAECREIAARCEEQSAMMRRVIAAKGTKAAYSVQVAIDG